MIKINTIPRSLLIFLLLTFLSFITFSVRADSIKIASGSTNGAYYPTALQICELINKNNSIVKCEAIQSSGSINNIELLKSEKVDFAMIQSDIAKDVLDGTGIFFGDEPYQDIRFVLSLFDEYLTIISKDESGILTFSDLNDKKIGVNLSGSGAKSGLLVALKYYNFLKTPEIINTSESLMALKLCDQEIDAVVTFSAHPNSLVQNITSLCNTEFVAIDPLKIESITAANPIYKGAILNSGPYANISHPVNTIKTKNIIVTSARVSTNKIEILKNTIRQYFDDFTKSYPPLQQLDKSEVFRVDIGPIPSK